MYSGEAAFNLLVAVRKTVRGRIMFLLIHKHPKSDVMRLSISLLLLLLLSCVHTNERPITETRSPVPARLIVREVRQSPCFSLYGGSCSHQQAVLRIEGPVKRDLPYGCLITKDGIPQSDITSDIKGDAIRVAFRCEKRLPFKVVYVMPSGRHFAHCNEYGGTSWNWGSVPDFRGAASTMIRQSCPGVHFEDVAAEIRTGGEAALVSFLKETLGLQARRKISMDSLQAWDDAYLSLSRDGQSQLQGDFRRAIFEISTTLALERSLRYVDINDAAFEEAIVKRLEENLNSATGYEMDASMDMMLRRLAQSNPQRAGEMGCKELVREKRRGALAYLPGALLVVAKARYSCPVVLDAVRSSLCHASFYCSSSSRKDGVCEYKDLSDELNRHLQQKTEKPDAIQRDRILLAAALSTEGIDDVLRLWHERRSYSIEQAASPECESQYVMGKKAVPCRCFKETPAEACSDIRNVTTCTFEVDDRRRLIHNVMSP